MEKPSTTLDLNKRVIALDVLRGVAILLVLGQHRVIFHRDIGCLSFINFFCDRVGWIGVDLFFVLSGFLIGGLIFRELQKTGGFDGRQFLIRRAFKIWPTYFALILYLVLASVWSRTSFHVIRHEYWPYFFHLQNYLPNNRAPQTWSLAVEEHFYLLLAFAIIIVTRVRPIWVTRHFWAVGIFLIGIIALSRTLQETFTAYTLQSATFPTHLRLDALLFGVVLGHLATFHPGAWERIISYPWLLLLTAICLISPVGFVDRAALFGHTALFTLLYLGFGAMLMSALGMQTRFALHRGVGYRILGSIAKIFAAIGIYSYGIYVWHLEFANKPVYHKLAWRVQHLPAKVGYGIIMVVYLGLAIVVGAVMTKVIEFPFLRMRDRWYPRVRVGAAPSPEASLQRS